MKDTKTEGEVKKHRRGEPLRLASLSKLNMFFLLSLLLLLILNHVLVLLKKKTLLLTVMGSLG